MGWQHGGHPSSRLPAAPLPWNVAHNRRTVCQNRDRTANPPKVGNVGNTPENKGDSHCQLNPHLAITPPPTREQDFTLDQLGNWSAFKERDTDTGPT
jgi:hypothetical protein